MTVIKLAFWSLLFLALVTMITGRPWLALAALVAPVIYGVTDTARKARARTQRERQRQLVTHEQARPEKLGAMLIAESTFTHHIDDSAINWLCNPN